MRIALLDFHRIKKNRIAETFKIAKLLKESGAKEVEIFEMLRNVPPVIDLNRFSGLVISGADSSHVEKYRGYKQAMELIDSLRGGSIQVLGICAGNQMIARVYNLEIDFMESPELGWYEIELTKKGKEDSLFSEMPERFISFQSHIKHVLPGDNMNFSLLGENKNCIQAIKYDNNIRGVQFHPEDSIEEGNVLINRPTNYTPLVTSKLPSPQNLICSRIFRNFISIVKNR